MKLDLDAEAMHASLNRWRETLDQLVPSNDGLHQSLLEQRPVILKNYERTAAAWLMALRTATPDTENQDEFDHLVLDIEAFQNWASAELSQRPTSSVLSSSPPSLSPSSHSPSAMVPSAGAQGVDALLAADPALAARIAELKRRFTPLSDSPAPIPDETSDPD